MDNLEKFIREHRDEFEERFDPSLAPLDLSKIGTSKPPQQGQKRRMWWWGLFGLILVTAIVFFAGFRPNATEVQTAQFAELQDMKTHYAQVMQVRLQSPELQKRLSPDDQEQLQALIKALDLEIEDLMSDLKTSPDQAAILEKIAINYKMRVDILDAILISSPKKEDNNERVYM